MSPVKHLILYALSLSLSGSAGAQDARLSDGSQTADSSAQPRSESRMSQDLGNRHSLRHAPAGQGFATPIEFTNPAPRARAASDTILDWEAGRKLTWDDYLASPEPGATAAASTATWLGMEYRRVNNELTFNVICSFSMKHSWGVHKTDYILAHEQGHFDIAEYCARLLHQRLEEYRFNATSYKDDLHRIYVEISKEKDRLQDEYDEETNHSINRPKQEFWLRRINLMLRDSAPYSNYRQNSP